MPPQGSAPSDSVRAATPNRNLMALRSEAVKLIKRGLEYSNLTRHFSGVSDAIDEALVTLENGGYISLPADYTRPDCRLGRARHID